ncbi:MAG: HlyD family efflux transporter periplasmic adaptor subunit, partial [Calditrichaeota bacterium]|nr:HlyD family efflux transporter periplasmic adaptor subunit [Calditrichota bacterium]
ELASANAALSLAKLRLDRTILYAPFNCRIRQESIDKGQYLNPGVSVARLFSTDMVEIDVGIPLSEVMWLDIPGATAAVHLHVDGKTFIWDGKVDRSVGVIGEKERLAYVVVQVKDPLKIQDDKDIELSIGTFVEVEIRGHFLDNIVSLPRQALRDDSNVWVVNDEGLLNVRKVSVERMIPGEVLISDGLNTGDKVILSSIIGGAEGMKLRVMLNGKISNPENSGDSQ